jgi:hypothetical protein
MKRVSQPRRGRKSFSLDAKRRNEIERLARHVGAADTEDFDRYLIAWYWHNPQSTDPLWSLMYAAGRMGGSITEAEASRITEEASIMRRWRKADTMARFLGLKYAVRQKLKIWTIGSIDIGKRSRTVLRKRKAAKRQEALRRAKGARPRAEYEANSLSTTKPWEELGMSARTWYRNKQRTRVGTSPCALSFLSSEDTPVPLEAQGWPSEASPRRKEERGLASSRTASTLAADIHVRVPHWCSRIPLELRLLALGLPIIPMEHRAAA